MNLIVDPALSRNNPNSTAHTAGTTFMGQFMDHDMTFDLTSRPGGPTDPEKSTNTRTPAFDLDSVYGGGPSEDHALYEYMERGYAPKFKIEHGGLFEDLPRSLVGRVDGHHAPAVRQTSPTMTRLVQSRRSIANFPHSIGFSGGQLPSDIEGSFVLDSPLMHNARSQDRP